MVVEQTMFLASLVLAIFLSVDFLERSCIALFETGFSSGSVDYHHVGIAAMSNY